MHNSSILSFNNSKRTTLRSVPWRLCSKGRPNMDEFTTMTVIEKADLDAKIEELTKERDHARGMYCSLAEWHDKTGEGGAEASAAILGWDVYEKEGKA